MRFGLRKQLLIVSLLTVALPWAGCQYVQEMEAALRSSHEDSLEDAARAVARVLAERPQVLPQSSGEPRDHASELYAHTLNGPVAIDGYSDDWGGARRYLRRYVARSGDRASLAVNALVAANSRYLYFFARVSDDDVRYLDPRRGPLHDVLLLRVTDPNGTEVDYLVETAAPGAVRGTRRDDPAAETGILGVWQPTAEGYQIELRMPRSAVGERAGFAFIDGDAMPADPPDWAGSVNPAGGVPARLANPLDALTAEVQDFAGDGRRVMIADRARWQLAEAGRLGAGIYNRTEGPVANLYRLMLDPKLPMHQRRDRDGRLAGADVDAALAGRDATLWYSREVDGSAVVSAAAPVVVNGRVIAAVVLEQPSEAILTLTNRALTRLVSLTMLATLLVAAGLLGFATWLSLRIRRLRNAAESALHRDGRIRAEIPGLAARDEIGDLSRSFAAMLGQLRDHTDYLRTLAGKLSHELRTPLAVVQSSLENLATTDIDANARVYAERASDGAQRLRHILIAMSEATRVEQSIEQAERERFDFGAMLAAATAGYQDTYADRVFTWHGPDTPCPFLGVPELLAQMLDKLVENAVDFTPPGGSISLSLSRDLRSYTLCVANEGPPLPAAMQEKLFESMVSLREGRKERPHLGFGLFIARLIAQFHYGEITARNLPADGGVEFAVRLPFSQQPG